MNSRWISVALLASLLVLAVLLSQADGSRAEEAPKSHHKLPKLFDFDNYKRLFGKSYSSLVESLNRKRLFFSRAFKAFASGLGYKLRRQSYYNAVNDMSDWSPEEREAALNSAMAETQRLAYGEKGPQLEDDDELDGEKWLNGEQVGDFIPEPSESFEDELAELIDEHASEPGFSELKAEVEAAKRRKKRELPPRDFSFELLIAHPGRPAEEVSEKLARQPPASNNPHYEPFELASEGVRGAEKVLWHHVKRRDERPFIEQAKEFVSSVSKLDLMGEVKNREKDKFGIVRGDVEWAVDLRTKRCFTPIRRQRNCGSCWAFATVAAMEWIYCNQTGSLVPFSEQYMIDCGIGKRFGLQGCEGAIMPEPAAWFVHNFGMELAKQYPYMATDGQCPYDEELDVKHTGYIRTPIRNVAQIHISRWHEALPYGPILVGVAAGSNFGDYGGGVYDGKDCGWIENHAMLLVGHGRQDGEEFWLIRNSYGTYWGESGYMKLSAKYAKRCVVRRRGHVLGSKDGINYDIDFRQNEQLGEKSKWQRRVRPSAKERILKVVNPLKW